MSESTPEMFDRLLKLRERSVSAVEAQWLAEVTARNKRIQAVGPRPVDGVTFGAGKAAKP